MTPYKWVWLWKTIKIRCYVDYAQSDERYKFLINYQYSGCSIRVETLGYFEGKSRLPRQNWGTLEKLPRDKSILSRHNLGTLDKFSRQISGTLEILPRQNSGLCYTLQYGSKYICLEVRFNSNMANLVLQIII